MDTIIYSAYIYENLNEEHFFAESQEFLSSLRDFFKILNMAGSWPENLHFV